eukprot:XP_011680598.1 PREDICTED: uncharacterized protein LOC105446013 isoform X1 [Strongylocentrotus purpuratus]
MCFRVKMFRVESYLLYIFYTWSIWTLTSTTVKCTNLTLDCTKSITVTSPNYPSRYPNGAFEEWYITSLPDRGIIVTFNDFNLEFTYDLINIRDMYHVKKPYTGENVQFPPYLTSGHTLHIEFTSSRSGRRKGFNISVSCIELSNALSGRLMDGVSPAEGFLELPTQSGEWKRVCEDSLTERVAGVICGELGYPGFKEISYENSKCASDQDNCTRAPTCKDATYRLVDCTVEHSMCSSEKVVKIICHEPGYKGCYKLDTKTLQNVSNFKFSSTAHCLYLCKTHDILAIAIMNQTDCVCFPSSGVQLGNEPKCSEETTSLSKMLVYDASVGFCEELNDTIGGSWDSKITWFGSIVHLTCMDGYSLTGKGTLQCVPGSSPYFPKWNDSLSTCEMIGGSMHSYRTTEMQEDYASTSTFFAEISTQSFNDHETTIMTDGYNNEGNDDCTYILLPILIGSTAVLFLVLLAVTICWIIPQIWKHFSSKLGSDSQIIHTYLDMRGRSPQDEENVSVASVIGGAMSPALTRNHPHDTVGQLGENPSKTDRNTIIYETIPSSSNDSNERHIWDIDDFGYVLPNPSTNMKENVTLLHEEEELTGISCKTLQDEEGYLILTM